MNVGIVGAGLSGLAAGRELQALGHDVTIWEKSRGPGGRCATRTHGDFVFDSGATSIAPRGTSIEEVMLSKLPQDELVQIEKPIFVHENLRVSKGDPHRNAAARYVYRSGINRLAKLLAEGLKITPGTQIEELARDGTGFVVNGQPYDALILTAPVPQTTALLWQIDERRPTANVSYRPCLSVMLGYQKPLETTYHALIDVEQRHPLTWLSIESIKSPDRAPEGGTAFVAQLSAAYSQEHFTQESEHLVQLVTNFLGKLFGAGWETPHVFDVMRWKYSQPEGLTSFDSVNQPGSRLIVTGDATSGARLEQAYESGVRAARRLCS